MMRVCFGRLVCEKSQIFSQAESQIIVDSENIYCYATHLIYVQRAFWAQLIETAGDPF